jgi:serine acetyltransferase
VTATRIDERAACDAAEVGDGTSIGPFAVVGRGAVLGAGVTIGSHVVVGDSAVVEDGVAIGPGAMIAAGGAAPTVVRAGAQIGAGAVVRAGVEIGPGAVVESAAVVTRSVPRHAIVSGNPARIAGYAGTGDGAPLKPIREAIADAHQPDVIESVVRGVRLHRQTAVRDLRGSLVAGELPAGLPFVPRRYFLVFDVPGAEVRGEHAHRVCHQFLVAVAGEVHVIVDDGEHREEFALDDNRLGLYLPPLVWGIQYRYSQDCRLLVLASHEYDPDDYIRDYGEFLSAMRAAR